MRLGSLLLRGYAWAVTRLHILVIVLWLALAAAAVTFLPTVGQESGGSTSSLGGLVPAHAPALEVESRSIAAFGYPLTPHVAVVERRASGLSPAEQAAIVAHAAQETVGAVTSSSPLVAAVPLVNTLGVIPSSSESGTTAVTYLYFRPSASFSEQDAIAQRYAKGLPAVVGVTGAVPATVKSGSLLDSALIWVEVATVCLIAVIVGIYFRSVVAPLVTLGTAILAYEISLRVVGEAARLTGLSAPGALEPLIVVLLLGVVTDYSIFFMSALRRELRAGHRPRAAAAEATRSFAPIIMVAGLTVSAGTASLAVARLDFLRAFAPGLALTVLTGLVVALTFIPACMAILARGLFWPSRPSQPFGGEGRNRGGRDADVSRWRAGAARLMSRRPVAALVALVTVAALVAAASGLRNIDLGFDLIRDLPSDAEARVAAQAAGQGFAPGIVAPTVVLVQGQGVAGKGAALDRLRRSLEAEPGVAGVIGPGEQLAGNELGVLLSRNGNAARFAVILSKVPYGATAIHDLDHLRSRLPELVSEAGLGGAQAGVTGDTALAANTISLIKGDLGRIGATAFGIDVVLLVLFLAAIVAPLYLLIASVLALGATLGLATYLFESYFNVGWLTYYVPFAAAVLLISLGSDYNVFLV